MTYRNSAGESGGKNDDALRATNVRVDVADFGGREKFESTYRPRGAKAEQEKTEWSRSFETAILAKAPTDGGAARSKMHLGDVQTWVHRPSRRAR